MSEIRLLVVQALTRTLKTDTLEIAYLESGPADGSPVVFSHRFPYDPHADDDVAPRRLAAKPPITVPAITLDGTQPPETGRHDRSCPMFKGQHEHRAVECGHNFPWEAPREFADAILTVRAWEEHQ